MLFRLSATMAAFVAFTASAQDSQPFVGAHGAMTPGTYTGVTGGRSEHLDLWPDQSFHLISGDEVHAGRWHADPERNGLVLDLGGETRVLEVRNSQRLRPSGAPEDGSGDLEASEMPAPASIRLPLSGMLTYFADAATIVHCATGRTHPVAQDGEYLALERAYLAGRSGPAEPLFVTMDALIEPRAQMEGPERLTVVPEAFGSVFPGGDCSLGNRSLDLADAVWTITSLGDVDLDAALVSRETSAASRSTSPRLVIVQTASARSSDLLPRLQSPPGKTLPNASGTTVSRSGPSICARGSMRASMVTNSGSAGPERPARYARSSARYSPS